MFQEIGMFDFQSQPKPYGDDMSWSALLSNYPLGCVTLGTAPSKDDWSREIKTMVSCADTSLPGVFWGNYSDRDFDGRIDSVSISMANPPFFKNIEIKDTDGNGKLDAITRFSQFGIPYTEPISETTILDASTLFVMYGFPPKMD